MPGQYHNGGYWISKALRLAIYLRDGFICLYCGRDLRKVEPSNVTLDHLITRQENALLPVEERLTKEQLDAPGNLVTACRSCNSARGCMSWRKFARGYSITRIANHKRRHLARYIKMAKAILKGKAANPRLERMKRK